MDRGLIMYSTFRVRARTLVVALLLPFLFSPAASPASPAISISIEQALDIHCDQVLDGQYQLEALTVPPGHNCIHYRVLATNTGAETARAVNIASRTPPYTQLFMFAGCSHQDCSANYPASGDSGVIEGNLDFLHAGASVFLSYIVKVE